MEETTHIHPPNLLILLKRKKLIPKILHIHNTFLYIHNQNLQNNFILLSNRNFEFPLNHLYPGEAYTVAIKVSHHLIIQNSDTFSIQTFSYHLKLWLDILPTDVIPFFYFYTCIVIQPLLMRRGSWSLILIHY